MFTGIVQEVGTVWALEILAAGARMEIACRGVLESLRAGDSIAVDGVCLTATRTTERSFAADLSAETLSRTNLGACPPGSAVNLETALRAGAPIGGHFVQGHVDGVGRVEEMDERGGGVWARFSAPAATLRYLVHKGSVAVSGISLTVAELTDDGFAVALVPFTLANTTARSWQPGTVVHLECDVLGKYVERFLGRAAR